MSRLKQLSKDSIIYGLGGVIAKSVSFFLLPIYTRIFSPAEYGTIEMLIVISSLVSTVITMGMDSAQSFYFFKKKKYGKKEQARVISAILQWKLIWGILIVVLATMLSPLLNAWLFNGELGWRYFAIAFFGSLFIQFMAQSAEVFRLLYRPWSYIALTLGQSIGAAISILVLIVLFDQGIYGYFLGLLLASLFVALIGWYFLYDYIDFSIIHSDWWPTLIRFGAPLLPIGLAVYVMNVADRWFVNYFHGSDMLGIYAVAAKFVMLMTLAVEIFRKAWWPIALDSMHSNDGPETFRLIARLYMGLSVSFVVLLTLASPLLVTIFSTSEYHDAYTIIGILAWQAVFYGFYLIAAAGIWKLEKTYYATIFAGTAAIINIGLNYLLVPIYGNIGAALATAVSFMVWNILSIYYSEKLWLVGFNYKVLFSQIITGVITVIIVLLLLHSDQYFLSSSLAIPMSLLLAWTSISKFNRIKVIQKFRLVWKV